MGTIGLGWDCVQEVSGLSGASSLDIFSTISDEDNATATSIWHKWNDYLDSEMIYRSWGQATFKEMRRIRALDLQQAGWK